MTDTPFQLIITRFDEVKSTIEKQYVAAVLSIEHPAVVADDTGYAPRLENTPQKILCFWDAETPVANGPDIAQVKAGLDFALEHIVRGPVLIHCHAGKARSAALALGVLSHIHPDWDENKLIDTLLAIRPIAAPNIIVVDMVDQLTGRNGKLLDAVKNHPVLKEQREKAERGRQYWIDKNPEVARKMFPEKFPKL